MNRDFLLKYILASFIVIILMSIPFSYDKEWEEKYFENKIIVLTNKIELIDLELNQYLLQSLFNSSYEVKVTQQLEELSTNYHKLSSEMSTVESLYNNEMHTHLNMLYSKLYQKRQAIEKFKYDNHSLNQHLTYFQLLANDLINKNDSDANIKNKIHQLQHLVLQYFLNSSVPLLSPIIIITELSQLEIKYQQQCPQLFLLVQEAKILFKIKEKVHENLIKIIKIQNPPLGYSIEQHVEHYFDNEREKKINFQNRLFGISILSVLYAMYLLSSLRKKSEILKKVLDDMKKYQIALNEHAIVSAADVKGNITYVNDKFCEISGYSKNELLGKNHRIIKSDEHTQEVFKTMWYMICHGKVWHGELKNRKKNGGFYWVNGTIVPFLNEKEKPYQYISIRTDITRQKELEKQLLDGQHFLKQVTGAMAQGLYALDENGLCTFWNKEAEYILGWSEHDLLNKKLHEIIHFQDENGSLIPRENCISYNSILNNKIYSSETESFTHKDGRILPISIISVPLLEGKKNMGMVAVFNDITKRKADERIIHQAIINAQQASQAKSDFLANMSHEIRTPMNGIIGMTELTLETNLDSEQKEYLEIVKDSSYALLDIVNDILDFSKIESGRLVLDNIEFNIHELLKKTLAILVPRAEQKGVALNIENTDIEQLNFPLIGDPGRLRQVIINLVGNAIKFTLQGSIKVKVVLKEKNFQKCCLLFTVTDTGIGIPDDKKDSIFEAFSQADTSVTRRFGGTGLGLSISKQFIELMAGKIWLESKPNEGTTFFFTCWLDYKANEKEFLNQPFVLINNPINLPSTPMTVAVNNNNNKLKLTILLAEDNLINQKLARKLLEKQGHEVYIANNGLEAIVLFKEKKFDLILMDFQMPEMNGLEATEKIRALEQQIGGHIPIIAMTANAMKEDKERAINVGMDAYVPKPINVQTLLTEISLFFPTESRAFVELKEPDDVMICNWKAALARLGGETEILEMLVNLFLEEQSSYLNNIKNALAEKDAQRLYRELHTLRGVCATIGAERLEKMIKISELAATQNDFVGCEQVLLKIEQNLTHLTHFLHTKTIH